MPYIRQFALTLKTIFKMRLSVSYKSLFIFQERRVIKYDTELCMTPAKIIFDKITKLCIPTYVNQICSLKLSMALTYHYFSVKVLSLHLFIYICLFYLINTISTIQYNNDNYM